MRDALLSLLAARKGHFRLESGHHGDRWLDLELLCLRPERVQPLAVELGKQLAGHGVEVVCGPLVEGAFVALMVASEMNVEFTYSERFAPPQTDALFSVQFFLLPVAVPREAAAASASGWATALPEAVGLDSAALVEMFDFVREHGMPVHSAQIVRRRRLALDAYFFPYNGEIGHDVASVTKSITSTLIGVAIEKGHLPNVRQPMWSLFPDRFAAALDERKRRLPIEHLLTMQAGWDCGVAANDLVVVFTGGSS